MPIYIAEIKGRGIAAFYAESDALRSGQLSGQSGLALLALRISGLTHAGPHMRVTEPRTQCDRFPGHRSGSAQEGGQMK